MHNAGLNRLRHKYAQQQQKAGTKGLFAVALRQLHGASRNAVAQWRKAQTEAGRRDASNEEALRAEKAAMQQGLAVEYGERQTEAATRGAMLVLKKVLGMARAVCGAQSSCALVIHVWGCRVALQRVLGAMREESLVTVQRNAELAKEDRRRSRLNLVRLILLRRETEALQHGMGSWRSAVTAMQRLAKEDASRSAYIRSQLEDAKRAFSQMLQDDEALLGE